MQFISDETFRALAAKFLSYVSCRTITDLLVRNGDCIIDCSFLAATMHAAPIRNLHVWDSSSVLEVLSYRTPSDKDQHQASFIWPGLQNLSIYNNNQPMLSNVVERICSDLCARKTKGLTPLALVESLSLDEELGQRLRGLVSCLHVEEVDYSCTLLPD
jgi:hypothetical protein